MGLIFRAGEFELQDEDGHMREMGADWLGCRNVGFRERGDSALRGTELPSQAHQHAKRQSVSSKP